MKLLSDVGGANYQRINNASSIRYLSHENEPENLYRNVGNKDRFHNIRNEKPGFLSDTDITFNYWFCVASKFLRNH